MILEVKEHCLVPFGPVILSNSLSLWQNEHLKDINLEILLEECDFDFVQSKSGVVLLVR